MSFPYQLWHLFISQAILVGIGSSMLYYPVTSLTPVFFDRHRGLAMGIAMAGSGAGGLVLAPVTQSIVYAVWCSRHAAHSCSVELCCLYSDLVRDASPPGVSSSAANFGARYEGDVHRAGTEIPSIYRHASA